MPHPQPNMLFILSDDQRFDTIGALGNPRIHTPNLDQLAHSGVAFRQSFCTTPICTPARAEILTGCQSFANGVPWFGMPINPELRLMPQVFAEAGYHTVHVGKWHNDGHPRDKGYAVTRRVAYVDNLNNYQSHGHIMRFAEEGGEVEGHSTELFTDAALEEIAAAPGDRPWFCYLSYTAPHDPHEAPEPFASMYDHAAMPLLPNFMPEHPFDNGDMVIRDELLENWPREQEAMRRYRARYYSIISHLDHHVGRVLGQLRLSGALENTVVVFTGDQGLAIGSHGLLGKENMYDHSISSPLIIAGPVGAGSPSHSGVGPVGAGSPSHSGVGPVGAGSPSHSGVGPVGAGSPSHSGVGPVGAGSPSHSGLPQSRLPAGGWSEALVHHVDLLPTLCELAGIERPESARDGFSLVPVMRGEKARVREEVFCEFYSPEYHGGDMRHTQRALRTERWKLTWYPLIERYQLFDLQHDPQELVDLLLLWRRRLRERTEAGLGVWKRDQWAPRDLRPEYKEGEIEGVVEDLVGRMVGEMERTGDPLLRERRPEVGR